MERLFLRRPAGGLKREPDLYDSLAAPLWRGAKLAEWMLNWRQI